MYNLLSLCYISTLTSLFPKSDLRAIIVLNSGMLLLCNLVQVAKVHWFEGFLSFIGEVHKLRNKQVCFVELLYTIVSLKSWIWLSLTWGLYAGGFVEFCSSKSWNTLSLKDKHNFLERGSWNQPPIQVSDEIWVAACPSVFFWWPL